MFTKFLAVILFIILVPLFVLLSIAIIITSGRPIFFLQKRLGQGGQSFCMFKFRTMMLIAHREKIRWQRDKPELWAVYESNNFKLQDDYRVTKLGKFLRKTSLDELPQLINIIKGEMSFVGPRPILLREKKYYGADFKYYAKLKPGVTGLWQVSGRSSTTFKERVKYDVSYAKQKSLWFDLKIILKTIYVVLFCKNSL